MPFGQSIVSTGGGGFGSWTDLASSVIGAAVPLIAQHNEWGPYARPSSPQMSMGIVPSAAGIGTVLARGAAGAGRMAGRIVRNPAVQGAAGGIAGAEVVDAVFANGGSGGPPMMVSAPLATSRGYARGTPVPVTMPNGRTSWWVNAGRPTAWSRVSIKKRRCAKGR